MNGLEDGGVLADVAGGGESESTDEAGAHVGENVTVQLHDKGQVSNVGWRVAAKAGLTLGMTMTRSL